MIFVVHNVFLKVIVKIQWSNSVMKWQTTHNNVSTVPKPNPKITETETQSIPLTHIYMTTHYPCFTLALQYNWWCSWLITGFVTRLTRRMPLVERELLTLPAHLNSLPVLSGVRVIRSLVLCVCFVDRFLSFCTFSFDHCVVCSSLIYGFLLHLWYLQLFLHVWTSLSEMMRLYMSFTNVNKIQLWLSVKTAASLAWSLCLKYIYPVT